MQRNREEVAENLAMGNTRNQTSNTLLFEVLTLFLKKITVYWDFTLCSLVSFYDVSEELAKSIFSVAELVL